ncbi:MAG TPA: response regulator [Alphaproteobacteria bacterium]|jgi:DNA-binding response OmpR family regulator
MKILLVDDDGFIREMVKTMLQPEGYDLVMCGNVDDAISALSGNVFDIIITDLLMPQKTGMDFIKHLKRHKIAVPVLAITGGIENAIDDYVNIGDLYADATLPKPVSKDKLIETITRLVQNHARRKA